MHAEAVHEHQQSRSRSCRAPRIPFEFVQRHRGRERIAGCDEVVADDAVQDRDQRLAFRRGPRAGTDGALQEELHRPQSVLQGVADERRHAADCAVHQPRRAPRPARRGSGKRADGGVHLLDEAEHPLRSCDGESGARAEIGRPQVRRRALLGRGVHSCGCFFDYHPEDGASALDTGFSLADELTKPQYFGFS